MRKIKFILLSALILCLGIMFVACKKSADNKLYVGTNAEFPPFEYLDNNVIVGFDIDVINEIAKRMGKEIEFKNIAFDGLLPALQAKKLDIIIAGMTADDERRKSVNFSEPYFTSKQAILINDPAKNIKTFADLPGKNVGVTLGYTGDLIVSKNPEIKTQRYNGGSEAIMALRANKIDAVVLDYEPAKNYAKHNEGLILLDTDLAEEQYAIAVRKEDTKLLQDINKALKSIRDDGTYEKFIEKYFDKKN